MSAPDPAATNRALWFAASLIIVTVGTFCTLVCLTTRGASWDKAIVCGTGTFNGIFAWWVCWRSETNR